MPELPEVETVARDFRRYRLMGLLIKDVQVYCPKMILPLTSACFVRQLKERRIIRVRRRAKYLILSLSDGQTLMIHLRMTGQFLLSTGQVPRNQHEHIVIRFSDGRILRYRDTRKFGRWLLTQRPEIVLKRLGPEPLSPQFNCHVLAKRLKAHQRRLKSLLLDQSVIAGLGNIYVDEALWQARLHPLRLSQSLSGDDLRRLCQGVRMVLRRGIRNRGTSLGHGQPNFYRLGGARGRNQDWLNVFQKTGEPCPRCGTPIVRLIVGQRSTHVCSACQTPPLRGIQKRMARRASK